jgi:putative ABC transport system ATP-binding protein
MPQIMDRAMLRVDQREDAMYVLEARNLRKSFGEGEAAVEALRGVNLGAKAGEMLAIMGRSGSGKSTMLTLLGGVDVPTSGQVLLEGVDLASLDDDGRTLIRRRRIGFVFQAFNLLPILTAEENVSLPLELDGVPPKVARERAAKTLELVGLAGRRTHLPGKMSGGEQQRVAIARALVIEPAILLADEPTGNLDSSNSKRITQVLRELVDHGDTRSGCSRSGRSRGVSARWTSGAGSDEPGCAGEAATRAGE